MTPCPDTLSAQIDLILAIQWVLLQVHQAAVGPDKCCSVEARLLPRQAVANRARLQAEADAWLAELATTPPGNAQERELWQVPSPNLPSVRPHASWSQGWHAVLYEDS